MTAHVLIIAGSDSSGGAGIARDIETISVFGQRSCLAVTAVTVQTHAAVEHVELVPSELVAAQMRAAFAAAPVAAVKIGMLGTAATIEAIGAVLANNSQVPVVVDPVLTSTSGRVLLADDAIDVLRRDLMPICRLVTPNLVELAGLTGSASASDEEGACRQAEALARTVGTAVLVKGGHAQGSRCVDVLLQPNQPALRFEAPRLLREMRGTGCMLSSAVAASLALGASLEASVSRAKQYVFDALAASKDLETHS
ncbi:hydroxymethylpyrimidine/phosphomethylpyrimidine kinase [Mesorhizobium sp.]|uniref:hydroxymethylpyrimidine/phosphomethylpyrimidine kinase n=1 Tax=Mesorhizobium sp. TaxID=1871066 RepID=UPI001224CBA3|nr:hydroxymethylpyrimidine/phosphomethylpyrimidine kinase [Mesorhizobium sp.]TIO73392.1 MAG: hydroxymethylpyrimidine/phosphomethylpyrimidine kinase [Mesorhizobium sp.]